MRKGRQSSAVWADSLLAVMDELYDWGRKANAAHQLLSSDMVISHRDLDPKNVLWRDNQPIVMDWESAGYIHPLVDLAETARYWSEDNQGSLDTDRLKAFLDGYQQIRAITGRGWRTALENGFLGKLDWLEYNVKRSLRMEIASDEEQQLGTDQAVRSLAALKRYSDRIGEYEKRLIDNVG